MNKRLNKYIFTLVSIFLLSNVVFAEEPIKDIPSLNNAKEKDICNAVKKTIQEGINTKDVVKTGIKLGHSACLIVKCAINGGGNVKEIVTAAIEAGATSDVVSRCAIDAGAEAKEVARWIMLAGVPGLCYIEPQTMEPIETPGGSSGGGYLSPSSPSSF
jgi:hypothetical protein